MASYTLIRSSRKTIAIHIRPDGGVEVRAPLRAPRRDIDAFVESKARWIGEKRGLMLSRDEKRNTFALAYGGPVQVLGEEWAIVPYPQAGYSPANRSFFLPPGLSQPDLKAACIKLYRAMARDILPAKVAQYAPRMGVRPTGIGVTGAKTRWGSCSGKGRLNFSWRLMMAPADVIDYVVVHELAHLREMNHSDRFWAVVAAAMPEYPHRRKALRQLQERLANEDW